MDRNYSETIKKIKESAGREIILLKQLNESVLKIVEENRERIKELEDVFG